MQLKHHALTGRRVYRLEGADGRDLLQRISTADLSQLNIHRPLATLLTNEKGRVVDVVGLIMEAERVLLLAGIGDDDGRIHRWLDRFIIMEDVNVVDVSDQATVTAVYAQREDGSWDVPPLAYHAMVPIRLGRNRFGLRLVAHDHMKQEGSGAFELGTSVGPRAFHQDRITAGVPWTGSEIGEHRHPLEARLRNLVSFTKGCYIGQEVIARLDSYRKVQMALTRFTGSLAPGEHPPIPLTTAEGIEAGQITSAAAGTSAVCALGFVRISLLPGSPTLLSPAGSSVTPIDTDPSEQIYT